MPSPEEEKKIQKNVRGPVVKEFEWFEMETRLRKIIQEIIEPIQHEIVRNSSHIDKLEKNNIGFNEKIQFILKMTTNDPEVFEKGVFKKIEEKFEKQQKTLSFLESEVKNNTIFIDNKITLIDERMKESNDMINQVEDLKASNRENLKNQAEKFDTIRKNIEQNVQTISEAIEQNQKSNIDKIERLEKQVSQSEIKMENIFKEFSKVKEYFEGQKSLNDNLIAEQIKLKEENRVLEVKISEINKKIKELNKIKPFLQDIEVEYKKVQFKVDNILPLITESQINECIYKILPEKFHPRIAVYEFEKYKDLNEKVLNRKFDTEPLGINFNGEESIRQAQERNTKLLTKLKLKYYKNIGVELDFISFEERERLMNSFDYQKLKEIIDELQELENEQQHNKRNMRLSEDDVINIVQKELETEKKLLIEKIHTEIQHSKIDLQSSAEVNSNAVEKLENKLEKLAEKFSCQKNDAELWMKSMEKNVAKLNINNENNFEKLNDFHLFNSEISKCLELALTYFKNINTLPQHEPHENYSNTTFNLKNIKKHPKYHSEFKNTKFEQQDDHQEPKNNNEGEEGTFNFIHFYDEFSNSLQNLKKHLESYQRSVKNIQNVTFSKARSSVSKLTKAEESLVKFKSHSSFDPFNKNKNLEKMNDSFEKKEVSEFLRIPEFKIDSGGKYCRESHTSRLNTRKKQSIYPSRALFHKENEDEPAINNSQIRNSLCSFNELRKEHKRYLN